MYVCIITIYIHKISRNKLKVNMWSIEEKNIYKQNLNKFKALATRKPTGLLWNYKEIMLKAFGKINVYK